MVLHTIFNLKSSTMEEYYIIMNEEEEPQPMQIINGELRFLAHDDPFILSRMGTKPSGCAVVVIDEDGKSIDGFMSEEYHYCIDEDGGYIELPPGTLCTGEFDDDSESEYEEVSYASDAEKSKTFSTDSGLECDVNGAVSQQFVQSQQLDYNAGAHAAIQQLHISSIDSKFTMNSGGIAVSVDTAREIQTVSSAITTMLTPTVAANTFSSSGISHPFVSSPHFMPHNPIEIQSPPYHFPASPPNVVYNPVKTESITAVTSAGSYQGGSPTRLSNRAKRATLIGTCEYEGRRFSGSGGDSESDSGIGPAPKNEYTFQKAFCETVNASGGKKASHRSSVVLPHKVMNNPTALSAVSYRNDTAMDDSNVYVQSVPKAEQRYDMFTAEQLQQQQVVLSGDEILTDEAFIIDGTVAVEEETVEIQTDQFASPRDPLALGWGWDDNASVSADATNYASYPENESSWNASSDTEAKQRRRGRPAKKVPTTSMPVQTKEPVVKSIDKHVISPAKTLPSLSPRTVDRSTIASTGIKDGLIKSPKKIKSPKSVDNNVTTAHTDDVGSGKKVALGSISKAADTKIAPEVYTTTGRQVTQKKREGQALVVVPDESPPRRLSEYEIFMKLVADAGGDLVKKGRQRKQKSSEHAVEMEMNKDVVDRADVKSNDNLVEQQKLSNKDGKEGANNIEQRAAADIISQEDHSVSEWCVPQISKTTSKIQADPAACSSTIVEISCGTNEMPDNKIGLLSKTVTTGDQESDVKMENVEPVVSDVALGDGKTSTSSAKRRGRKPAARKSTEITSPMPVVTPQIQKSIDGKDKQEAGSVGIILPAPTQTEIQADHDLMSATAALNPVSDIFVTNTAVISDIVDITNDEVSSNQIVISDIAQRTSDVDSSQIQTGNLAAVADSETESDINNRISNEMGASSESKEMSMRGRRGRKSAIATLKDPVKAELNPSADNSKGKTTELSDEKPSECSDKAVIEIATKKRTRGQQAHLTPKEVIDHITPSLIEKSAIREVQMKATLVIGGDETASVDIKTKQVSSSPEKLKRGRPAGRQKMSKAVADDTSYSVFDTSTVADEPKEELAIGDIETAAIAAPVIRMTCDSSTSNVTLSVETDIVQLMEPTTAPLTKGKRGGIRGRRSAAQVDVENKMSTEANPDEVQPSKVETMLKTNSAAAEKVSTKEASRIDGEGKLALTGVLASLSEQSSFVDMKCDNNITSSAAVTVPTPWDLQFDAQLSAVKSLLQNDELDAKSINSIISDKPIANSEHRVLQSCGTTKLEVEDDAKADTSLSQSLQKGHGRAHRRSVAKTDSAESIPQSSVTEQRKLRSVHETTKTSTDAQSLNVTSATGKRSGVRGRKSAPELGVTENFTLSSDKPGTKDTAKRLDVKEVTEDTARTGKVNMLRRASNASSHKLGSDAEQIEKKLVETDSSTIHAEQLKEQQLVTEYKKKIDELEKKVQLLERHFRVEEHLHQFELRDLNLLQDQIATDRVHVYICSGNETVTDFLGDLVMEEKTNKRQDSEAAGLNESERVFENESVATETGGSSAMEQLEKMEAEEGSFRAGVAGSLKRGPGKKLPQRLVKEKETGKAETDDVTKHDLLHDKCSEGLYDSRFSEIIRADRVRIRFARRYKDARMQKDFIIDRKQNHLDSLHSNKERMKRRMLVDTKPAPAAMNDKAIGKVNLKKRKRVEAYSDGIKISENENDSEAQIDAASAELDMNIHSSSEKPKKHKTSDADHVGLKIKEGASKGDQNKSASTGKSKSERKSLVKPQAKETTSNLKTVEKDAVAAKVKIVGTSIESQTKDNTVEASKSSKYHIVHMEASGLKPKTGDKLSLTPEPPVKRKAISQNITNEMVVMNESGEMPMLSVVSQVELAMPSTAKSVKTKSPATKASMSKAKNMPKLALALQISPPNTVSTKCIETETTTLATSASEDKKMPKLSVVSQVDVATTETTKDSENNSVVPVGSTSRSLFGSDDFDSADVESFHPSFASKKQVSRKRNWSGSEAEDSDDGKSEQKDAKRHEGEWDMASAIFAETSRKPKKAGKSVEKSLSTIVKSSVEKPEPSPEKSLPKTSQSGAVKSLAAKPHSVPGKTPLKTPVSVPEKLVLEKSESSVIQSPKSSTLSTNSPTLSRHKTKSIKPSVANVLPASLSIHVTESPISFLIPQSDLVVSDPPHSHPATQDNITEVFSEKPSSSTSEIIVINELVEKASCACLPDNDDLEISLGSQFTAAKTL